MSARAHVYLNVAIALVAAVFVVVALTLDTRTDPAQPPVFKGKPPVPTNVPGVIGSQIEQAFREWPRGSIDALQRLGLTYPSNALVQYYRGVALVWAGYPSDAEAALELAKKLGRNTYIQEKADNLLHPSYYAPSTPPYYPVFEPLSANPLLEAGAVQQEEGHQVSAERDYEKAVRLDPSNAQAQVAAAVGLFDEDNLNLSFGKLGPLTARFPKSQVVHYYLALLLAWTHQSSQAVTQWEDTVKLGASTALGRDATRYLEQIAKSASPASSAG